MGNLVTPLKNDLYIGCSLSLYIARRKTQLVIVQLAERLAGCQTTRGNEVFESFNKLKQTNYRLIKQVRQTIRRSIHLSDLFGCAISGFYTPAVY